MLSLCELFAKQLREIRDFTGMSRERFAEVLDISASTLASLERGIMSPSLKMLERLASGMKVQAWELLRFDADHSLELRARINNSITTN